MPFLKKICPFVNKLHPLPGITSGIPESDEDSANCVVYGPSTENKIERWWRELLERLDRFFKDQLRKLLEDGDYERDNQFIGIDCTNR